MVQGIDDRLTGSPYARDDRHQFGSDILGVLVEEHKSGLLKYA